VNAGDVFRRSSFDMTASPFFRAAAPFLSADGTTRFNRTGFTGGSGRLSLQPGMGVSL
jgi:hypothetical protein